MSKEIKPHPLSKVPDDCFKIEEGRGRYKDITKIEKVYDEVKKPNSIRFVCISDTHNKADKILDELPQGDVLIHAGDFTEYSMSNEIVRFNEFLGKARSKFENIVVIAGNHDMSFDKLFDEGGDKCDLPRIFIGSNPNENLNSVQSKEILTNCTHYLEDEQIELYGIKIYGSPWQPEFCDMGFNAERGKEILTIWNKIPDDTEILMTHGPPLGIGDRCFQGNRVGCAELLVTIKERVKPKYHIFGHVHECHGVWNDGKTTFINASTCNHRSQPVNKPIVFDYVIG